MTCCQSKKTDTTKSCYKYHTNASDHSHMSNVAVFVMCTHARTRKHTNTNTPHKQHTHTHRFVNVERGAGIQEATRNLQHRLHRNPANTDQPSLPQKHTSALTCSATQISLHFLSNTHSHAESCESCESSESPPPLHHPCDSRSRSRPRSLFLFLAPSLKHTPARRT